MCLQEKVKESSIQPPLTLGEKEDTITTFCLLVARYISRQIQTHAANRQEKMSIFFLRGWDYNRINSYISIVVRDGHVAQWSAVDCLYTEW